MPLAIGAEPDCAGVLGGPGKPPGHRNLPMHLTSHGYHVSLSIGLTTSQLRGLQKMFSPVEFAPSRRKRNKGSLGLKAKLLLYGPS